MRFEKGFVLLTVAGLLWCSLFVQNIEAKGKVEKVIATGSGLTEEKAIQNVSKTAIQQVVGMYVVSDTVMENRELIKDQVLSQSNAYIRSFKVLNKSKDEDGLFSVEAEVEVEAGRLTNKLGQLNIAVKHVGTEEFIAISLDKFGSSEDFKAMADRIMFQPLRESKKIYDIKIKRFDPLENYEGNQIEWLDRIKSKQEADIGEIKPFRVIFNISLNSDYVNSVTQFLEKSSKQVFDFYKKGETNVYLNKIIAGQERKKLGNSVLKTFVLTPSNYNIYKILHLKHGSDYQPVLIISLLGDDNSSVIQTSYFFRFANRDAHLSSRNSSVGPPNMLNMSELLIKSGDSKNWTRVSATYRTDANLFNMVTGLDDLSGLIDASAGYKHPEGFFKNTQDLSFIMFLNKETIKKVKSLKLELLWLEFGKIYHQTYY